MTAFSYFAQCLIHGECGFEKNLRLAKDLLKVSIGALKTLEKDPAPDKALLKHGSGSGNHPCKYYELRHVIAHPTR